MLVDNVLEFTAKHCTRNQELLFLDFGQGVLRTGVSLHYNGNPVGIFTQNPPRLRATLFKLCVVFHGSDENYLRDDANIT